MERLVIAIDGPSGVGKSSLGKALARRLGILYIDSGAVYRAVAQQALDEKVPLGDAAAVADLALRSVIRLEGDPDHLRVFLDGREVTREIRTPETSQASSIIATIAEVTFYGHDQAGNDLSATGTIGVNFGNFADPL